MSLQFALQVLSVQITFKLIIAKSSKSKFMVLTLSEYDRNLNVYQADIWG